MHAIRTRVAKFKHPRVLCDQKISEDNQKLRPGCPPDYQIFCKKIDPKTLSQQIFQVIFPLPPKTAVSELVPHTCNKVYQNDDEDDQIFNIGCPPTLDQILLP